MANDSSTLTAAQCQTALAAFIVILRAGGITCPIVLAAIQDISGGITPLSPWADYAAAMKAIAAADPTIIFIDHSTRLPSTAGTDTYGLYSTTDHLHPRPNGIVNAWMAATYRQALAPR